MTCIICMGKEMRDIKHEAGNLKEHAGQSCRAIIDKLILLFNEHVPYIQDIDTDKKLSEYPIHLDSIDLVNLLISIEDAFNCQLDTDMYVNIFNYSLREIVEVLASYGDIV